MKLVETLALLGCALFSASAGAQAMARQDPMHTTPLAAADTRELLTLSPGALSGLRTDMQHMLVSLSLVLDALSAGKRKEAAQTLEERLGMTAMNTHPGMMKANKELPEAARMLGMSAHQSASRLAASLEKASPEQVFAGLHEVAAGCAACHSAYRAR